MNILLVNNTASFHFHLSSSLNKIKGINAKYIVYAHHPYIAKNQYEILIDKYISRRNPINYLYKHYALKKAIKKWIEWADVIYYIWDSILDEFDLKYAKSLNKKLYVEWVGSDIRNPELLMKINPYYKATFYKGYEYKEIESSKFKNIVQNKFSLYNAKVISTPEMLLYIDKEKFSTIIPIMQRCNIQEIIPNYPIVENNRPLIIHSPSAPIAKGSNFILPIIEELKKEYSFDFKLLTGVNRNEVLSFLQKADIFIDQFIGGSYGMASIEAMSYGKPTLCYLMPELFENGLPSDCPIINTHLNNLKENLIRLITNGKSRREIGIKSRAYVVKYHDSDKIASNLVEIFRQDLVNAR